MVEHRHCTLTHQLKKAFQHLGEEGQLQAVSLSRFAVHYGSRDRGYEDTYICICMDMARATPAEVLGRICGHVAEQ